jgi:hypothetical protein
MATEQIPKGEEVARDGMGRMAAEWHRVGGGGPHRLTKLPGPTVTRGAPAQQENSFGARGENLGEAREEGRNYALQLRLHPLLHLVMRISLGNSRK